MSNLKYTDCMLDIETLGQGVGCAIISVAAVPFFKPDGKIGERSFHMNVDLQSCLDIGLSIDSDTLSWWMKKSDLFLRLQDSTYTLKGVLLALTRFIRSECTEDVRVWGRGPSFDQAILRDAYIRHDEELPWRFPRERCVRTYLCGYEERLKKNFQNHGEAHHPVDDCIHQIRSMAKVQNLILHSDEYELD